MSLTPADYSFRQLITGTSPSATNTGQVLLITEDNVHADFWTNINNGGGALRICEDSAGVNQLPVEVILCDTTAETLIAWTRKPSYTTSDRDVYLFAKTTGSKEVDTATYGSQNVWQDLLIYLSLDETTGSTATDRAGNRNGTYQGGLPNLGTNGQIFDGVASASADRVDLGTGSIGNSAGFSYFAEIYSASIGVNQQILSADSSNDSRHWQWRIDSDGKVRIIVWDTSGTLFVNQAGTITLSASTTYRVDFVFTGSRYQTYINGTLDLDIVDSTTPDDLDGTTNLYVGARQSTITIDNIFNGQIQNVGVKVGSGLTSSYITTRNSNQSNTSTFWTQGTPDDPSGSTYSISLASGSYAYTGSAVTLAANRKLGLSAGSYTYTGNSATLKAGRKLPIDAGSYTYTGSSVTLTYNAIGGPTYTLALDAGSYALTGNAVGLAANRKLLLSAGSYSYTGQSVNLLAGRALALESGSYTYTGSSAALKANRSLSLDAGSYVYTGQSVTLSYSGVVITVIDSYTINFKSDIITATFADDDHTIRFK